MNKKKYIVVYLSSPIMHFYLSELPHGQFAYSGQIFSSYFDSDNNGFYDWLRNSSGVVIGVQWTFLDDYISDSLPSALLELPNVEFFDEKLKIYFNEAREYLDELSCDQCLGGDNLFVSDEGRFAVSFAIYGLASEDCMGFPKV